VQLTIASRGSKLALAQTGLVAQLIRERDPSLEIRVVEVRTTGDKDARPFAQIGGKGLFVAEAERAVQSGEADLAVHSAKDLTADLADGCSIVCVPERGPVEDVVVGGSGADGHQRLGSLPPGSTVGTSSMRRRALLAEARSDLDPVELRGNLDTRLRKVSEGVVGAALLARAGLQRLPGAPSGGWGPLDPEWWIPAPGQGALAIEARHDRGDLATLLAPLDDPAARTELICERSFARTMEGGCSVPLGCLARVTGDRLVVNGFLGDPEGVMSFRDRISGGTSHAAALGAELAQAILGGGGEDILAGLRDDVITPEPP
jgi:hydroxymethylbilane synthase